MSPTPTPPKQAAPSNSTVTPPTAFKTTASPSPVVSSSSSSSPPSPVASRRPVTTSVKSMTPVPQRLRRFPHIPVFIVEGHNDVLEYVYRCFGARYLPFQGCALLHFDSHPDMTIPRNMPASHVRHKERLLSALSIENWIMPACYAGHFDRIVWCKPPWAKQMPVGEQRFSIGDYAGVIGVSCALEYFVSEGSYRPVADMEHTRPVLLHTIEVPVAGDVDYETVSSVLGDSNFVLDIDLDFFSTHNPFLDLYPLAGGYEQLLAIFEYERPAAGAAEAEVLRCSNQRADQLDDLERIFKYLTETKGELRAIKPASPIVEAVWPLLERLVASLLEHYAAADIDWTAVYNAGCTRDSRCGDLPHHESTLAEIDTYVRHFEDMLRELLPAVPTVITVARSSDDDYCPVPQVDMIQERVWKTLGRVYGDQLSAQPILYYKETDWSF